jgi:glycosyltransferase involved in cell wall biosynthesis
MRLPTIGIDGFNLAMPHGTGVATYGYTLAETLRRMGASLTGLFGLQVSGPADLREIMFYDLVQRPPRLPRKRRRWTQQVYETARPLAGFRLQEVPMSNLVEKDGFVSRLPHFDRVVSAGDLFEGAHAYFEMTGRFTRLKMENPPEVMHWTYPVPVWLHGSRNVYTLHDMVPLRLPYTTLDTKRTYYRMVERCVRNADHICTVSEASRNDIVSRFPVEDERLSVTYQSAILPLGTLESDPAEDAQMIEGIFGLRPQSYFLYFGAIEPKKNIGRLIEAYLTTQTETPLVIVGARAWEADQELKLLGGADGLGTAYGRRLTDRIIRLEYLPRRLLFRLIRGARAVTFPSLYEGFGLPVHEAMLLGTPVLTGCTSSLPEVAGDAALLVDPYDVDAIAEGIRRLDRDELLRSDLAARGVVQSGRFSVENYSARLGAMYQKVMERPSRGVF